VVRGSRFVARRFDRIDGSLCGAPPDTSPNRTPRRCLRRGTTLRSRANQPRDDRL